MIEILLTILVSILAISEIWRANIAIKQEIRNEKLDTLMTLKLQKEIGLMSQELLERELKNDE